MRIESDNSDRLTCLANQIFIAFPREVTGLKFCILDCGCIYYQRVYGDSGLDVKQAFTGMPKWAFRGLCDSGRRLGK